MAVDFFMKRYDESGVEDEIGFTKFLPLVLNDIVIAYERLPRDVVVIVPEICLVITCFRLAFMHSSDQAGVELFVAGWTVENVAVMIDVMKCFSVCRCGGTFERERNGRPAP